MNAAVSAFLFIYYFPPSVVRRPPSVSSIYILPIMAAAGSSVLPQVQGRCLADITDIPPVVPDCCIIIAISKTSFRTSVIYALQLEDGGCIKGTPFRLYQPNGREYIWPNRTITRESISFGSVLRCQAIGDILTYRSNTAKRMVSFIRLLVSFMRYPVISLMV